ncbi:MAG TPA: hypothetical protein VIO32_11735, partial [Candidatus Baltobacteraceae bacterium]
QKERDRRFLVGLFLYEATSCQDLRVTPLTVGIIEILVREEQLKVSVGRFADNRPKGFVSL